MKKRTQGVLGLQAYQVEGYQQISTGEDDMRVRLQAAHP